MQYTENSVRPGSCGFTTSSVFSLSIIADGASFALTVGPFSVVGITSFVSDAFGVDPGVDSVAGGVVGGVVASVVPMKLNSGVRIDES